MNDQHKNFLRRPIFKLLDSYIAQVPDLTWSQVSSGYPDSTEGQTRLASEILRSVPDVSALTDRLMTLYTPEEIAATSLIVVKEWRSINKI